MPAQITACEYNRHALAQPQLAVLQGGAYDISGDLQTLTASYLGYTGTARYDLTLTTTRATLIAEGKTFSLAKTGSGWKLTTDTKETSFTHPTTDAELSSLLARIRAASQPPFVSPAPAHHFPATTAPRVSHGMSPHAACSHFHSAPRLRDDDDDFDTLFRSHRTAEHVQVKADELSERLRRVVQMGRKALRETDNS